MSKIAERVDDATLDLLAAQPETSSIMSSLVESQYFWYKRAEVLVKRRLQPRPNTDWKTLYKKLASALQLYRSGLDAHRSAAGIGLRSGSE